MSDQIIQAPATPATPIGSDASVETYITLAIQNNVPVETLERLFSLREKVKAERAREAFTDALAQFQGACPVITKSKKVMNKDGRTIRYVYAPIDAIVEEIRKPLADNGLSYTFDVTQDDHGIKAVVKVTHRFGHSETSSFTVPVDKDGYMTAPQKVASALTFAKRYALCNALGISTGDEDTDATDVNEEKEPLSDKSKIVFLLRTLQYSTKEKADIEAGVKKLTKLDLEEENYPTIVDRLEILVEEAKEGKSIT